MKTRNGFVSNSSSSSFVFVGFPTSELGNNKSHESIIREKYSEKDIDRFALENLNDTDYKNYRKGNIPLRFWDLAYDHFQNDIEYTQELPENYEKHAVWNDGESSWWQGICVASVSECGSQQFDPKTIAEAVKKIKKDYPKVTPKVVLIASN